MPKKKKLQKQIEAIACGYVDNSCAANESQRIAEGISLAIRNTYNGVRLVGIPQGREGHAIIFGGSGSGKSTGSIMATLNTWKGRMVVTDPKGELYRYYKDLYDKGLVERPPLLFDPTQAATVRYDPFWFLRQNKDDLMGNITELVHAIIPIPKDCREPYWIETARAVLVAGILYYFRLGLNFSKTLMMLMNTPLTKTLEILKSDDDALLRTILGSMAELKCEELASHDREFRNSLMCFATDARINNAFDCTWDKDKNCFCWDDLRTHNVFIRIPEERIEQWSAPLRLMITQLFSYLERRPDKLMGTERLPVLLLLDEFARFGKIEGITNALSTLRSKDVHIVLALQSLAQLDKFYGVDERRIICDNCEYKLILQAGDSETQKYLSDLVGVRKVELRSRGKTLDVNHKVTGYSKQKSETYLPIIFPHKLATLEKAILLSNFGAEKIDKLSIFNPYFEEMLEQPIAAPKSSWGKK